jgi:hypothetical protein
MVASLLFHKDWLTLYGKRSYLLSLLEILILPVQNLSFARAALHNADSWLDSETPRACVVEGVSLSTAISWLTEEGCTFAALYPPTRQA